MSLGIVITTNSGIVLAADRAAGIALTDANGRPGPVKVFKGANRIFPIPNSNCACLTMGSLAYSKLATQFVLNLANSPDPRLMTPKVIAEMLHLHLSSPAAGAIEPPVSGSGFVVAGFDGEQPESWAIFLKDQLLAQPDRLTPGIAWAGEAEGVQRLLVGYSPLLRDLLISALPQAAPGTIDEALTAIRTNLSIRTAFNLLPVDEAVSFAISLVSANAMYGYYQDGVSITGGGIEAATLTRMNGFQWALQGPGAR